MFVVRYCQTVIPRSAGRPPASRRPRLDGKTRPILPVPEAEGQIDPLYQALAHRASIAGAAPAPGSVRDWTAKS